MTLRDRLPEHELRRPPGRTCAVCWLLDQLEPDQATEVVELIDARAYTDAVMAEAIRAEYRVEVGDQAIGRHRRGRHHERTPA